MTQSLHRTTAIKGDEMGSQKAAYTATLLMAVPISCSLTKFEELVFARQLGHHEGLSVARARLSSVHRIFGRKLRMLSSRLAGEREENKGLLSTSASSKSVSGLPLCYSTGGS